MIGRTVAHYRIEAELGRGGMGVVYRATDSKLGRQVALKTLPAEFLNDAERLRHFENEARLLAALNHPGIASIYGMEDLGQQRFLVLEFVPGETLGERIRRGPLETHEVLPIFQQIAAALEAAHDKGIVHRDLKPDNIKITPEGKIKILDFGLAAAQGSVEAGWDLTTAANRAALGTRPGQVLGTTPYMSPEQARGKPLDKRTDIWSFGCTFYEALAGHRAFPGATFSDTVAAVLEREPDWTRLPAKTPPRVESLLRRCLQKDASRRLRDIGDARIELEELQAPGAEGERAASVAPALARWLAALPWALAALAVSLAAWALLWLPTAPRLQPDVQFTVQLPAVEGLLDWGWPSVAVSPDGTQLVYNASSAGVSRLFLRKRDQLVAQPIPGTEGAYGPFFSPDGNWIGFFVDRSLRKVDLRGGIPVKLAVIPPINCGAAWVGEGTLVTTWTRGGDGLFRIPANGGQREMLTQPDRSRGEVSHCWPQALPGGNAVLFTVMTKGGSQEARIAILRLDTRKWETLVEHGTFPQYVATGHLLFARGDTLMAVRFDPRTLKVTGTEVPVFPKIRVHAYWGGAQFALSQEGTLAYVTGESREPRRTLAWVDRRGSITPLKVESRSFASPALSPDGNWLAVTIHDPQTDLWMLDLRRNTLTRLTFFPGSETYPVWTPDGHRVVYSSDELAGAHEMVSIAVDGTGTPVRLIPREGRDYPQFASSISANGPLLAFSEDNVVTKGTGWDILVLPLTEKASPRIFLQTPFDEDQPSISPDSRWLAYVSDESGRREVYVQSFPEPGNKRQISTSGGNEPRWAHSGRELFYRQENKMMAVGIATRPEFRVSSPRELFSGPFQRSGTNPGQPSYDVALDDSRFLMILTGQEAGPSQINVVLNWFEHLKRQAPSPGN